MSPAVTVIGCDGRPPSPQASQALATAQQVIGAPRHLAAVPIPPGAERMELKHLDATLETIDARSGPVAVLASGDPGFFGIVRALRARGIQPRVIPATSSVTLAFARLGLDWDDALVISAHGRDPGRALAAALAHPKTAILTAPGTVRDLSQELLAAGKNGVRRRMPGHRAGKDHRPRRASQPGTSPSPTSSSPLTLNEPETASEARPAGWPATRAPRTAGRCPRTRSSTATR